MIFYLMDKLLFSTCSKDLPGVFGIWVQGWNKAEKALSVQVAINKQKEIHRSAPHIAWHRNIAPAMYGLKAAVSKPRINPHHCKCCNYTGSRICPCNYGHLHVFLLKSLIRHFAKVFFLKDTSVNPDPHVHFHPWESGTGQSQSNMADSSSGDEQQIVKNIEEFPLSSIIPAIEEARKRRPPFVPSVGLPNVIRTPQELMVERVMENCAFKSVLAGVVGMKILTCWKRF